MAFLIVAARQLWLEVIAGPRIAANAHNPRLALQLPLRGSILARDGTTLARSSPRGRIYPHGRELAQTVGYVSTRYGTAGLEDLFNRELAARAAPSDPLTQFRSLFERADADRQLRGSTVVTTIDPVLESTLFRELDAYARAAGIVIDVRTGEILALASVPSFNPARVDSDFASIRSDPASPLLNRATAGLYPPGSTFKIVTAANALDAGVIEPSSTFVDPGTFVVGDFVVHDNEGEVVGTQDLTGAFALSSNVDFAQINLRLGADRWFEYASRWRFGESFGPDLIAELDRLPNRADVTPSILAQLSFGQADLLMTPLRMALVAATIARGGAEPQPTLVRAIRSPDGRQLTIRPRTLANPISRTAAAKVRSLMVAAVQHGTGTAAALVGVTVAGKTGTATNPAGKAHAWFVAFAPAEAPRIALAIVVENGGYGGTVAAPIARRVISAALARRKS